MNIEITESKSEKQTRSLLEEHFSEMEELQ